MKAGTKLAAGRRKTRMETLVPDTINDVFECSEWAGGLRRNVRHV